MKVELVPDFPVDDATCKEHTGKTFGEWADLLAADPNLAGKRRDAINWVWDQVGRSPQQAWWGTTIWVEYERKIGRTQKDGLFQGYNICNTKSIKASAEAVQQALLPYFENVVRVREGKDIRAIWHTPGVPNPTQVDVMLAFKDGKTGVNINHDRIQTREEADGLRRAWGEVLNKVKAELES